MNQFLVLYFYFIFNFSWNFSNFVVFFVILVFFFKYICYLVLVLGILVHQVKLN